MLFRMRVCGVALLCWAVAGCSSLSPSAWDSTAPTGFQPGDPVRNADLSPRLPKTVGDRPQSDKGSQLPMLFPGSEPDPPPSRRGTQGLQVASTDPGAVLKGDGVEMSFDGADIQTVAKTLLGDILKLNYIVDPRVQGNVTLASSGTIPRKDVLPAFEAMLQMSNAALVHDRNLVKIVPMAEAGGKVTTGVGQLGFGVSIVRLRNTSATAVARTAESFLTKPGAIRVDAARNLLLVQGTSSERQAAMEVASAFDAEWLRHQSVGVYPIKSTSPETMIQELERVFESSEGGLGQGVIRFQPISRMNAVMVIAKNPKLLEQTTQWVQRLDRADNTGTTLRTYRLKHGNAPQVARILSDIFGGQRPGGAPEPSASQTAPGVETARSKLDSLDAGTTNASTTPRFRFGGQKAATARTSGQVSPSLTALSERESPDADVPSGPPASAGPGGGAPRGVFQGVRITADMANNAIVVYSNQEDYRVIERAMRELDRPRLQVAIEAMVAEVTLTRELQFGVQFFLTSNRKGSKGSVGLYNAASSVAQGAVLERVLPGFNLLFGSDTNPRVIINALSDVTSVKVLSSPSIVVVDNQPALLQVGDEVPITTSSATLLASSSNPVVNTIEMRNTGVILKVLPRVHADGTIQLEIDQEISNVVEGDQQSLTPTISQRRVHSTVGVTSGQMVLLGGLISEREQKTRDGVPGLREVKFLGDLFGNTSTTKQRSEIIMFIRPQLIRNALDARHVAEEFRDKLQSMRAGSADAGSRR